MTFWVAGAVVAGSAINAYSANKASSAQQQSASSANTEAAREYDQTRQDQLDQLARQRSDQQPWLDAGKASLAQLASGTGAGGSLVKPFSLADFQADPGYGFRLSEGEKGIQRAASARGGLYSGATLKALARFNQDTASGEYGAAYNRYNTDQSNQFNRLASIAGLGQTATNQVGQAGQNAYGTIASAGQNMSSAVQNNMIGAGNARASGYVGTGNALNNGLSQYLNYNQNQNLLSKLSSNSNVGGYNDEMARINSQLYSGG
jgi:hypothetical protein